MGNRKRLFKKSLVLHNSIAKRFGSYVDVVPKGSIMTKSMLYDDSYDHIITKEARNLDYVRYRILELVMEEINSNNIEGCCAEAGVFLGAFSSAINKCFPDRKLYLYDTYEGFDNRDLEEQTNKFNVKEFTLGSGVMDTARKHSAQEQIEIVKKRLVTPQNAVIRKGYFPESVGEESDSIFAFVSLDMDYYRPLLEGLKFFWPRMAEGGYIFMHDYNCHAELTEGAHRAVKDAQEYLGVRFHYVPLPDFGGTLVIIK